MPQIGPMELLVVAVIALIVFGPRRLPEIARSVGKAFSEFKRQATEVREEFEASLSTEDPDAGGPPPAGPPDATETPPTGDVVQQEGDPPGDEDRTPGTPGGSPGDEHAGP